MVGHRIELSEIERLRTEFKVSNDSESFRTLPKVPERKSATYFAEPGLVLAM